MLEAESYELTCALCVRIGRIDVQPVTTPVHKAVGSGCITTDTK